jgi:hypothetical protein
MTAMIGEEFPKLIFNNSGMRYGVARGVPMLDDKRMLSTTSVLEFYDLIQKSEDIVPYQKGFLINTEEYVGTPILQERIFNYEKSLAGEFESDSASRSTFFERVNGFCFVERSGTTIPLLTTRKPLSFVEPVFSSTTTAGVLMQQ